MKKVIQMKMGSVRLMSLLREVQLIKEAVPSTIDMWQDTAHEPTEERYEQVVLYYPNETFRLIEILGD